jgi:hypothetical protein
MQGRRDKGRKGEGSSKVKGENQKENGFVPARTSRPPEFLRNSQKGEEIIKKNT